MRGSLKKLSLLCTTATLCLTLFASCRTAEQAWVPFPEFPKIEAARNGDGTVSISEEDLVRLAEFKLKYKALVEAYGAGS